MSLADILHKSSHLSLSANNKIKCSITGHEMPPNVKCVEEYLKSKKLAKTKEWYSHDYDQYLPLIVPHKENPKMMFCLVSQTGLNKIPAEIEKHINGKKYERLKEIYLDKVRKSRRAVDTTQKNEEDDADIWVPASEKSRNNDGNAPVEKKKRRALAGIFLGKEIANGDGCSSDDSDDDEEQEDSNVDDQHDVSEDIVIRKTNIGSSKVVPPTKKMKTKDVSEKGNGKRSATENSQSNSIKTSNSAYKKIRLKDKK